MWASTLADVLVWPVRLLESLVLLLPLRSVQRVGVVLGWMWYHLLPIRRRVVHENLALAFPDLAPSERSAIARGCYVHVTMAVLELFWLPRMRSFGVSKIVDVEGWENYERAIKTGKGVIAITAHLGNWDLLACSQALARVPLSIITKELSSKRLGQRWMQLRTRAGVRLLADSGSMMAILRALRKGEVVGMIVDQRMALSKGASLIDFFGKPAATTLAPAVLAARTGAALLPVYSFRKADGRHVVRICKQIALRPSAMETMAEINRLLEEWIRLHPEQWLWQHRRWLV